MAGMDKAVKQLGPLALAVVSLVVIIGIGSVVLAELTDTSYDTVDVTNETFNATSNPYNYTVSDAGNSDFVQLESATVYESTSQSSTGNVTILDAEAGKVNVEVAEDAPDESLEYSYSEKNKATGILGSGQDALSTFGDFLTVIVVVGVASIIFLLLGVLRKSGSRTMA